MLLPPGRLDNNSEYVLDECPLCKKDSHFSWNVQGEYGHCWVCDGTIVGYDNLVKCAPKLRNIEVKALFTYGKGFKYLQEIGERHYENAWDSPARDWLMSRGVNELTSYEAGFMWEPNSGVVSCQLDPTSPELPPATLYRWPKEGSKWYVSSSCQKQHYAFNLKRFEGSKKNILLCEGIFDILATAFLSRGIALCGSKASNSLIIWLEKNVNKVILWLDNDEAGGAGVESISRKFLIHGIDFEVIHSEKDPKLYSWKDEEDRKVLMRVKKYLDG